MTSTKIATYLPLWEGKKGQRAAGHDEDAVTMAVAAGIQILGDEPPNRVVLVTRQPALLEGGSSAAICAGLGVPESTEIIECIGGAASLLDTLTSATANTLVIGVDVDYVSGAGAGAVLVGTDNAVTFVNRVQRSLPTRTRHIDGSVYQDDDARLTRERGVRAAFDRVKLASKPLLIAGLSFKNAKPFCTLPTIEESLILPTEGASSPIFALALLSNNQTFGLCAAFDQACLSVANIAHSVEVTRFEPNAQPRPKVRLNEGSDIKIALPAYDRAFESKLKMEAGSCNKCGTLAMPPRYRCLGCGAENNSSLTALPRSAEVYTTVTIHIPIPGLVTPYTLVMAQLEGVDVRMLVTLTDAAPASVAIGDKGAMVFRRVAVRSGVPDYGYAFSPLSEQIAQYDKSNQTIGETA